jgi:hypothetical protein
MTIRDQLRAAEKRESMMRHTIAHIIDVLKCVEQDPLSRLCQIRGAIEGAARLDPELANLVQQSLPPLEAELEARAREREREIRARVEATNRLIQQIRGTESEGPQ